MSFLFNIDLGFVFCFGLLILHFLSLFRASSLSFVDSFSLFFFWWFYRSSLTFRLPHPPLLFSPNPFELILSPLTALIKPCLSSSMDYFHLSFSYSGENSTKLIIKCLPLLFQISSITYLLISLSRENEDDWVQVSGLQHLRRGDWCGIKRRVLRCLPWIQRRSKNLLA